MRVALVTMPFAALDRPSLGLSALKSRLNETGIGCDVIYLNLAFARLIGRESYDRVVNDIPYAAMAGEWIFTECLYGDRSGPRGSYVDDVLHGAHHLTDDAIELVLGARRLASRFIDETVGSVSWAAYDIVGFTSVDPQNLASLALARRVREAHPEVAIVFGGHRWEGAMGRELHRRFPFVDFALSGEADLTFPALVDMLGGRAPCTLEHVPGLVYRRDGRPHATSHDEPVADLDALPIPDHSDYFGALSEDGGSGHAVPAVPLETSRGCWWAAERPCLFCGLNGTKRTYRTKSAGRILRELRTLGALWHGRLDVVDNVVSPTFLDEVLPEIAAHPLPAALFFEVRPTVRREHVRLMAAAGASIQSGIESLSDRALCRMGKGTNSLANIRLLKWCKSYGVNHTWNVIYGVPGETPADYEQFFSLLPAVRFLDPPDRCGPVVLERFSRYFEHRSTFGIRGARPHRAYRHLYPFPDAALRRIAYFFERDGVADADQPGHVVRLRHQIELWQKESGRGTLASLRSGGKLVLVDSRHGAEARRYVLDDVDCLLYEACDDICRRDALVRLVGERFPSATPCADEVSRRLVSFVERRLMVAAGERYLSLAVPQGAARAAPRLRPLPASPRVE